MGKKKIGTEINITPKDLKAIVRQYDFNEDDIMEGDDRLYEAKKIMSEALERSEFIIYCLYLEYASTRKVGEILGVSKTPVRKELMKIREKINNYVSKSDIDTGNDSVGQ